MSLGKEGRNGECKAKENQKIMGHFQVEIVLLLKKSVL